MRGELCADTACWVAHSPKAFPPFARSWKERARCVAALAGEGHPWCVLSMHELTTPFLVFLLWTSLCVAACGGPCLCAGSCCQPCLIFSLLCFHCGFPLPPFPLPRTKCRAQNPQVSETFPRVRLALQSSVHFLPKRAGHLSWHSMQGPTAWLRSLGDGATFKLRPPPGACAPLVPMFSILCPQMLCDSWAVPTCAVGS